jgi:hypothetical protein
MLLIRERVGATVPLALHHFENSCSYLRVEAEVYRLHRLFEVDLFSPNYAVTALTPDAYKGEQVLKLDMKSYLEIKSYSMELWWRGFLCFAIDAFLLNNNVEISQESYYSASRRRKMILTPTLLLF